MKLQRILVILTAALATCLPMQGMQRVVQQTYPLPKNGTVKIDTYRGFINVAVGDTPNVEISVRSLSQQEDEAEARSALDTLQLRIEQVGNEIRVVATNPVETGVRLDIVELRKLEINFEIIVPSHCNLDLSTKEGGITVDSLVGNMKARTETGSIFFRQIQGNVVAESRAGDIVVSRCSGSVDLRAMQGNVRIGTVGGRATLETVNGDIEVMSAYNTVSAKASDGDISAGFAQIVGPSSIRTALGNVTAVLNPEDNFSIRAYSRWGKVINEFPAESVSGKIQRSRLVGDYRGGGPQINIQSSGGSVRLKTGEPLFAQ
jgi:DUF4097 and DUF4098 domain-containing protein YvlB